MLSELNLIALETLLFSTFPSKTDNVYSKVYIFDLLFRRRLLNTIVKYKPIVYLPQVDNIDPVIKDTIAIEHLTSEQKWVLSFVRQGYTLDEIAKRLHTHKKYISTIIEVACQ